MDYQNRAGNKGGGVAGDSEANVERRERLRKLALETIDVGKDPYLLRTHLGTLECRLCLTTHINEGSYIAHTQGKKHSMNLSRRAARDAKFHSNHVADTQKLPSTPSLTTGQQKKTFVKIGRPGYKVTKIKEPSVDGVYTEARCGILFQILLPEIRQGVEPLHRIMSAFEQHVEAPPDRAWQYLVIAAEPYETIAFKIQSREIDQSEGVVLSAVAGSQRLQEPATWSYWDVDSKTFTVQVVFKR